MLDLSTPRRQSKLSILLYVFKNIKGLILFFLYAIFGIGELTDYRIVLGLSLAFLMIGVIAPFLNYYYFTFQVVGDELIIQKGVLQKERKAIPLERIQSVNITQNLVQRILQLVAVELETAGSKAKELEIPGLNREFAESFKNLLQEHTVSIEDVSTDIEHPADLESGNASAQSDRQELLELNFIDLLKVALTQNHLRSGFLALGVVVGFWYKIQDIVERFYGDIFENFEWEDAVSYASISLIGMATAIFIVVALLVSLVTTVNKYYGFSLRKSGNYLELEMGLLNRREVKIPLKKVQLIEFKSNPLRRLLRYQTATIFQAQSDGAGTTRVEVPACSPAIMRQLQHIIFAQQPSEELNTIPSIASSHARLRFYVLALPILSSAAVFVYFGWYVPAVLMVLVIAWSCFNAFKDGQRTAIQTDNSMIILKKGWLFPIKVIMPVYKMQAIEKWRSIFLKRRRQTHIQLHTAAGSRGLRYFKEDQIAQVYNQINNQVITSNRGWM